MDENTIEMNRQGMTTASHTPTTISFVSKYRKPLFWMTLIILMCATWYFSRMIETRGTDTASIFLGGHGINTVISLYSTKADPNNISIRRGDSVEFVVRDISRHDIAERRTSGQRGDARIASGEFSVDESYSLQFNTSGTFSFYDRLNQDISIDIEVR